MAAIETGARVEEVAQDLFGVLSYFFLATPRNRRHLEDLKEVEFLALALLHARGTMIVGQIQRQLGVLPAQMSRIIRSLENRTQPLISCQINSLDKRKIDVCLTDAGTKALLDYQATRFQRLMERLRDLPEEEQDDLVRLIEKLRSLLVAPHE